MKILLDKASAELSVKGSRFIADAFPIQSQNDARETLMCTKRRYPDATHVVHAFVAGLHSEVCGMSDDGEPSGTAGRPVLSVLQGSGITNILITVTRYFGGTLLGTGGLVHAYSESARRVLSAARVEEYTEKAHFSFSCGYDLYPAIKRVLDAFDISDVDTVFGSDVAIHGNVFVKEKDALLCKIKDISKGRILCT